MSKFLQVTSALALIFMSSETFASNTDELELGLYRQGLNATQVGFVIQNRTNIDQQELELYRQGLNKAQVDNIIGTFHQNPGTTSGATPVSIASVVSVTPTPTLEEAVQKAARSLVSLKDQSLPSYTQFRDTFFEYLRKAPVEKKEYAFPHFINKVLESRLYDFPTYYQWSRAGNSHKTNQAEKSMASTDVQRNAFLAYMYKAMDERYNIQVNEFKKIGSNDSRSLEDIVQSTFNSDVRLNTPQNITNDLNNIFNGIF